MTSTLIAACLISCLTGEVQDGFRITGVVRDIEGSALPGAKITLDDGRTAVADEAGRFELASVTPGTYEIRARLVGFRVETQQIHVGALPTTRVEFELQLDVLVEVMPVAPEPREAYQQADAIAHVRIVRQLPPLPCSELPVGSALHNAVVLSALKGSLPTTINFLQDSAGTCIEESRSIEGINRAKFRLGERRTKNSVRTELVESRIFVPSD